VRSFYYLAKITKNEMVCAMAVDFREHGKPITVVALAPGWMHTEVMDLTPEQAAATQSTEYLGRAVVALARDPDVAAKSGRLLRVSDMAREYGFTDVDGRQP
jgi:NAD(P)-dependent dehydrogenase (short-subunit alcohol dehydrogenase family)